MLIDASKLLPDFVEKYRLGRFAVDAVEVVRCRECRYGLNMDGAIACTEWREQIHKPDDFCSYGERRQHDE